jgi:cell division protein FtsZ
MVTVILQGFISVVPISIFGPEDLDNDDVISAVEQTPTYKRTREILASIGNQNVVEEIQRPETPETQQGVISFV